MSLHERNPSHREKEGCLYREIFLEIFYIYKGLFQCEHTEREMKVPVFPTNVATAHTFPLSLSNDLWERMDAFSLTCSGGGLPERRALCFGQRHASAAFQLLL